ncbi:hypothetical protein A5886_002265 [Enterococcus sp. 8G7_MSG3316]|uniref:Nucleic acid-binding protein n=1 Tax=Candidatus Enterococcus testudinis TaxID=1834191 RepID=A0A242A8C0_9ENTE|nr:DUF177 domain-containing protein [Enterococcus sp. 8G7_MSG3316]OTN77169.1 hypothetical protein A5886_002265 [Enterococcus sp. 8G7_MSG3316]
MKWSLLELRKYQEEPLVFDETLDLKHQLIQRDGQILDLSPVKVKGFMSAGKHEYLLHYQVETTMTLPSTRSLAPVAFAFDFSVDECFMTPEQFQRRDETIVEEEVLLIDGQTISLDDSVADNLLLAIPLQVLTDEEKESTDMPSGNDWAVLSEEDYAKQKETQAQQVDPRLAKLSELFNNESDDDNA